jgi:hypothetical protein
MAYIPATAFDANLKPEFTSELELGANIGLLNDRIIFDFAWYNRKTTDQIAPLLTPQSSGKSTLYTNFGEVDNKGIEIATEIAVVKTNDLQWNLTWVYTQNENIVVSLYGDSKEPLTISTGCSNCPTPILEVGKPYGYLRGTKVYRDDEGNILINPSTGLTETSVTEGMIGNPYPKYTTSVISSLSWKGFNFGFVLDYQKGGSLYSNTLQGMLGRGVTEFNADREGGFIIPGYLADPNDLSVPYLDENGQKVQNFIPISAMDVWFTDGFAVNSADEFSTFDCTNIRLREISLSYSLPKSLLKKLPIGSLEISFTARNLWFYAPNIPKYTNYDPIASTFGAGSNVRGIEYDVAPSTKRYGINLKFTF